MKPQARSWLEASSQVRDYRFWEAAKAPQLVRRSEIEVCGEKMLSQIFSDKPRTQSTSDISREGPREAKRPEEAAADTDKHPKPYAP